MPCAWIGAHERMCPSHVRILGCLAANKAVEVEVAEARGVSVGTCVQLGAAQSFFLCHPVSCPQLSRNSHN